MGTPKRERQKANRQARLEELHRQARKTKAKRTGMRWGIGIPVALLLLFGLIWLVQDDNETGAPSTVPATLGTTALSTPAGATTPCPAADGSSAPTKEFAGPIEMCIDPTHTYTATFDTSEGSFEITFDTATAPNTSNNFISLARYHFYDGTKFFRADNTIDIIQGGGTSPQDQFSYTIPDEGSGFTYVEGDVAMANTGSPNSGGAQFFIGGGPKISNLDTLGSYVKFAKVTSGLDVVKKILSYAEGAPPMGIAKEVTVNSVTITESATAGTTPGGTTAGGTTPAGTAPAGTAPSGTTSGGATAATSA